MGYELNQRYILADNSTLHKKNSFVYFGYSYICSIGDLYDYMYKFIGTIEDILNKDESWYSSYKKCHKKVKFNEYIAACTNRDSDIIEYKMRLYSVLP